MQTHLFILSLLSLSMAAPIPDSPGSTPSANSGLGGVGDAVNGLAGGAGTLGFLIPSPNGSGANFVNGLVDNPAGAITGTPDSILPYGLLDGGKPVSIIFLFEKSTATH